MKETDLKVMGIVGIRSGSKGVPDKNIKLLSGKPLIGWILETAKESKYINRLIVSTDSQEYADIATSFGANVPYLRPQSLATDDSQEFDYIKHMIEWLKNNEDYMPDIVVRMMATSPFQRSKDIDIIIEKLIDEPKADSAVIVSEARQHPEKALKIIYNEEGVGQLVTYYSESGREVTPVARQSYTTAYFRANVIAFRTKVVFDKSSLTGDLVRFHVIPQDQAIDIDNKIDFAIAECLWFE